MIKVKNWMKSPVLTISKGKNIVDAAKIMSSKNISCIVIEEKKKPIGIITERDFSKKVIALNLIPDKVKVEDIMSKKLITIDSESDIGKAAVILNKNHIKRLLVTKGKNIVGVFSITDFIENFA